MLPAVWGGAWLAAAHFEEAEGFGTARGCQARWVETTAWRFAHAPAVTMRGTSFRNHWWGTAGSYTL